MATVLCVDDEAAVGVVLEHTLTRLGHTPVLAASAAEAMAAVGRSDIDLIIADYVMPGSTGLDLLKLLSEQGHRIPVIIMTGYSSIESAVTSIKSGAIDYLTKPVRPETLEIAVNQALEVIRLRRENESFRTEIRKLRSSRELIGESPSFRRVMETIAAVAPTRATVLLEGESGTGKELFARAIHDSSPRADGAFVTVNCAALPEGLVESALFGHERGAFTGATARAAGAFERAHGGTLLLDEISEMRLDLQAKLLRAIQEQEFERVGGSQSIRVDVRLIATTNRDLKAEVDAGRFRSDLYYRLNVMPIRTPPLRERVQDIPRLAHYFLQRAVSTLGTRPCGSRRTRWWCFSARSGLGTFGSWPTSSSGPRFWGGATRSSHPPSRMSPAASSPRNPPAPPRAQRRPPSGRRMTWSSTFTNSSGGRSIARWRPPVATAPAQLGCSASASGRSATG